MGIGKGLVALGLLMSASVVLSSVSIDIELPPYWSGTFCKAGGSATVSGAPYGFIAAKLYVDNQLVAEDYPEMPVLGHIGLGRWVDSTHFADGSSVQVKLAVQTAGGAWVENLESVVVKNRGWAFNQTVTTKGGNGAPKFVSLVQAGNWNAQNAGGGWTRSTMQSKTPDGGLWWVAAHHAVDSQSGAALHSSDASEEVPPYDYYIWKSSANGTNTPPDNSTGNPQFSYAYLTYVT